LIRLNSRFLWLSRCLFGIKRRMNLLGKSEN
jgi:hypothetical protein